jgi:shikimate kinase
MDPTPAATALQTTLTAVQTGVSGDITKILVVCGVLFALVLGIKLVPKLIRVFAK